MTRARRHHLLTLVGCMLFLAAGVGLWLDWGVGVWLLQGAALLAIHLSLRFNRPAVEAPQDGPQSAERVLRWYPKWW